MIELRDMRDQLKHSLQSLQSLSSDLVRQHKPRDNIPSIEDNPLLKALGEIFYVLLGPLGELLYQIINEIFGLLVEIETSLTDLLGENSLPDGHRKRISNLDR